MTPLEPTSTGRRSGSAATRPTGAEPESGRRWVAVLLTVIIGLITAMWIYAWFFANNRAVNRIDDRAWSGAGESRCLAARAELFELRDPRSLADVGDEALTLKADIVEETNVILTAMVDDLAARLPVNPADQAIVPKWIADYRMYLADRVAMVEALRSGTNAVLNETEVNGTPISYFINDFARQNEMPSCNTPLDLAV